MLVLWLLACTKSPTAIAPPGPTGFAGQLEAIRADQDVPALGAARFGPESVDVSAIVGTQKRGADTPLPSDARWHLGSNTKSMTAALLLAVEQEGLGIGLDTTLETVWPGIHEDHQATTLRQLLAHTGGLTGSIYGDHPELWTHMWEATDPVVERAHVASTLLALPADERSGRFTYSNAGFILVGAALEAHLESSWEDLLTTHVFDAAGMNGCGFGAPTGDHPWGHSGSGDYQPMDPDVLGSDNPAALGPAGTVHCTLESWAAYGQWVARGVRGDDPDLPAEAWQDLLTAEADETYAGGWIVLSDGRLAHDGSNTLWYARIVLDPETGTGILAATNAGDAAAGRAIDAATEAAEEYQPE